jgi:hypothetical protein
MPVFEKKESPRDSGQESYWEAGALAHRATVEGIPHDARAL